MGAFLLACLMGVVCVVYCGGFGFLFVSVLRVHLLLVFALLNLFVEFCWFYFGRVECLLTVVSLIVDDRIGC